MAITARRRVQTHIAGIGAALSAPTEIKDDGPQKEMCHEEDYAALALAALISIPTFNAAANAAPVSPASSSFGSNGY
jgi:hypothetical protein